MGLATCFLSWSLHFCIGCGLEVGLGGNPFLMGPVFEDKRCHRLGLIAPCFHPLYADTLAGACCVCAIGEALLRINLSAVSWTGSTGRLRGHGEGTAAGELQDCRPVRLISCSCYRPTHARSWLASALGRD